LPLLKAWGPRKEICPKGAIFEGKRVEQPQKSLAWSIGREKRERKGTRACDGPVRDFATTEAVKEDVGEGERSGYDGFY